MTVVVVSWLLILMAAFGMNHSRDAVEGARTVQRDLDRHQLRAWARSGVELARFTLDRTDAVDCAALARPWADHPLAGVQECGRGRIVVFAAVDVDGGGFRRRGLGDEAARLPVAIADSVSLSMLPGMTADGAEALLAAVGTAGEHRLAPFGLLGLDETSLASARGHLSRYGKAVNVNTASSDVLQAIGLPESAVRKLKGWLAGADRIRGTGDDRVFESLDGDAEAVRECGLNSEEAAVMALLAGSGRLKVVSRYFNLRSIGWGEGMDGVCEVRAVLEKPAEGPTRIVEWSENWLN